MSKQLKIEDYQEQIRQADQIMEAVKKGYVKTPEFQPTFLKDATYLDTIRQLCKQAVYSTWNLDRQTSTLLEIYHFVNQKIKEMISTGQWDVTWKPPSKRTVDRRVNECADQKLWEKHPPLIALKGGVYIPNPALFEDEAKQMLEKLCGEWR